jgi:serine protease Do
MTARNWFRLVSAIGLLVVQFLVQHGRGQGPGPSAKAQEKPGDDWATLPAVFTRAAPESAEDLKQLQEHVKKVLKKVMPATVGIRIGNVAGSGVIIDAEGHVLTAGHVSGKPGRACVVILPDGKMLKARTLGQNVGIDSGLIQITSKGPFPHLEMGDSAKVLPSEWVLSIGHPGGFKIGRTPVVRLGRVSLATGQFIRTDCTIVTGDYGGPLIDMRGRVIGIHSRIGFAITENVHVPVNTYKETWDRLVKSDSWGSGLFGRRSPPYLGIRFTRGSEDLKIAEVYKDTPGARAGLLVGDVIVSFDGTKLSKRVDLLEFLQKKRVGDEVVILVQRGGKEVTVRLKLGPRPGD